MEKIRDFFFRTKTIYTGIFFFLYILYRCIGCPIISYLCGQELDFFVPILFVAIYYILIIISKVIIWKLLNTRLEENLNKKLILLDFLGENLFYITSAMFIYDEAWLPYFYIRTSAIILINLLFAFLIFRKGLVLRYNLLENERKPYKNFILWFIALLSAIIAYFAVTYFLRFLWRNLIAG